MALDLQYDLANYTPADSAPVEANFNRVQQYINTDVITRDGVTAMVAQLQLIGNPVGNLDAVPKQYVDAFVPIGAVWMFAGATAPPGGTWALCNGAELEQAAYPALFAVIGQTYGGTAGHFNLPNLAGKFPIGAGTDALASTGGSRDNTVAPHTHPIDHTVPAMTTGTDTVGHTHDTGNHTHAFSGSTGGQSAAHHHWMKGYGTSVTSTGGGFGEGLVADITSGVYGPAFNTSDGEGDHGHSFTGTTAGMVAGAATGLASSPHQHITPATAVSATSGAASGAVAAANANLPPYLAINYIIRIV